VRYFVVSYATDGQKSSNLGLPGEPYRTRVTFFTGCDPLFLPFFVAIYK
jgi:hypothetical protein